MFDYQSKFVDKNELIEGSPVYKLKNNKIKEYISTNKYIDAFILIILNSFEEERQPMPQCVKEDTEISNLIARAKRFIQSNNLYKINLKHQTNQIIVYFRIR